MSCSFRARYTCLRAWASKHVHISFETWVTHCQRVATTLASSLKVGEALTGIILPPQRHELGWLVELCLTWFSAYAGRS